MSQISKTLRDALRKKIPNSENLRLFEGFSYPTQLKNPPGSEGNYGKSNGTYFGEGRGFYPERGPASGTSISNGYFQPWNSFHHDASDSDGDHRSHAGIDIYAPYFPFPYEIPVRAVASGTIWNRTEWGDFSRSQSGTLAKPDLGNRISLYVPVKVGGKSHLFVFFYGHLNRFAQDDRDPRNRRNAGSRRVRAGDIIGYVGLSGNADTKGEASTRVSPFNVGSGHLHLAVAYLKPVQKKDGTKRSVPIYFDPLDVLTKSMGFHPDANDLGLGGPSQEKTSKTKAADWIGADLKESRVDPDLRKSVLRSGSKSGLKRPKTKSGGFRRATLPRPFQTIDVDDTAGLRATRQAYELMKSRLEIASYKTKAIERWKAHFPGGDTEEDNDTTRWGRSVWALSRRADSRFDEVKKKKDAGHAIASAAHLHEALYILLGGPAFEVLGQNGGKKQVACGIGMRGSIAGLALDGAVAAIHFSKLPTGDKAQGAVSSVASVTFGSGGIRHATFSWASGSGGGDADYRSRVWRALTATYGATKTIRALSNRLSANDAGAKRRCKARITFASNLIRTAGTDFMSMEDSAIKDALDNFLDGSIAHFKAAEYLSTRPETPTTLATPRLHAVFDRPVEA